MLSTTVTNGLPAGAYRMCSINTASNHQPCLVAIAQHGGLDDCSYVSLFSLKFRGCRLQKSFIQFEAVDGGDRKSVV